MINGKTVMLSSLTNGTRGKGSSSLALKILFPVLGALVITCIFLFTVYNQRMKDQVMDNLKNQLSTFTASKAAELTEPVWSFQDELVSSLMRSYRDHRDLFRISLYNSDGELIVREFGTDASNYSTILKEERQLKRLVGDDPLTLGRIVVEFHDGAIETYFKQRRRSDIILTVILVAVLGMTVWVVLHFLIGKPLLRIKTSLRGNLACKERVPLVWNSRDELGEVVTAYNALLREVGQQTRSLVQINTALQQEIAQRREAEAKLEKAYDGLELKVAQRTRELERANERLMELDMQRSAFLSSASHELRTPLAAILGFSALIKKNFSKYFMPHADEHALKDKGEVILSNLEIVNKEGDRLTRLIDDLLDLNKIEAGRMEWRDTLLNVSDEVHRSIKTMESTFTNLTGLVLKASVAEHLPPLCCDPDRFQQLLLNLLSNAIKHTDRGEVGIEAEATNGNLFITVYDTGKGIRDDELDSIFDKFYQAGGTDTHKPSGTGLGLPICKNIVEHYNGTISVESQLGKGTRFILAFPMEETVR